MNMDTIWDPQAERMPAEERADLQARRLDDLLGRLAERSPIYRERLAAAGVGPGAKVGLDGLADLPFTTKQDLWDAYPWGLLAVPREQVLRGRSYPSGHGPTVAAPEGYREGRRGDPPPRPGNGAGRDRPCPA